MKEEKKLELVSLKVREKAEMRELDLTRFQEDPSHMELEKCCGNCCWFYGEDSDGWGFCVCQKEKCDGSDFMVCSDLCTTDEYVSRQEMRHHMAVLLRMIRHKRRPDECKAPPYQHEVEALVFAYKYLEVFDKL